MDLILGIMIALLGLLPIISAKIEKQKNNKEKEVKLKRTYKVIWALSILLFITMATREIIGYYSKNDDKKTREDFNSEQTKEIQVILENKREGKVIVPYDYSNEDLKRIVKVLNAYIE